MYTNLQTSEPVAGLYLPPVRVEPFLRYIGIEAAGLKNKIILLWYLATLDPLRRALHGQLPAADHDQARSIHTIIIYILYDIIQ
jgi:hypothetical protein